MLRSYCRLTLYQLWLRPRTLCASDRNDPVFRGLEASLHPEEPSHTGPEGPGLLCLSLVCLSSKAAALRKPKGPVAGEIASGSS